MPDSSTTDDAGSYSSNLLPTPAAPGELLPVDRPAALVPFDPVRALWVVTIAAVVGDLVTTVYGIEAGFRERNPAVRAVYSSFGPAGLVALKLLILGWVSVIWVACRRIYGIAALAGLMLPQAVAVGINVTVILGMG